MNELREQVRDRYAAAALRVTSGGDGCGCGDGGGCCGSTVAASSGPVAAGGYGRLFRSALSRRDSA